MAIIRVNATGENCCLHGSEQDLAACLRQYASAPGPAVIMIHGYSYQPGHPVHCPHRHILALDPQPLPWAAPSWPRGLGFDGTDPAEGLAIAFGWSARGSIWRARGRAIAAGRALASVVTQLRRHAPRRNVHIVAHSMGIEVAAEALHHLPAGSVDRILSLTGASYRSRVAAALGTPAGCDATFVNVTSRENDLFDCLYERLIAPPARADRALGQGLDMPNAVTLQLDCLTTLDHLRRLGARVAPPARRICHWSAYLRPGILQFYRDLLRQPETLTLNRLRAGLPRQPARRWSRLLPRRATTRRLRLVQDPL
ncbi:alpha/beta hydrolase [Sedimentitalea sp. HM32M-2]|uniref:alpha/beta hydrolase n=1 Tax=Sedimentitalea sp. HM32M-2 TaxID=3351566 RepID=UPI00363ECCA3